MCSGRKEGGDKGDSKPDFTKLPDFDFESYFSKWQDKEEAFREQKSWWSIVASHCRYLLIYDYHAYEEVSRCLQEIKSKSEPKA